MRDLFAAGALAIGASGALSLIAKATVVTAIAILAGWMARRGRAAVLHLIYVAAFVALALLPVAAAVMPTASVPIRLALVPAATEPLVSVARGSAQSLATAARSESRDSSRVWPAVSTPALLTAVWLTGVICCLAPVAVGLWQIHRVRRLGRPWHEAQMMTNDLAHRAGFAGLIDVMVHETISGPATCGVMRRAILFPPDARTWCDVDVRRALSHEFEHVRRHDWIMLCLARVTCAVYWFHPLVWIANRQLLVNAERACDDAVLRNSEALDYANQLVTVAERARAQAGDPLLALAARGDLAKRVRAVLDLDQQRGPAGLCTRISVAIAAVIAITVLAPLRTVVDARARTTLKQSQLAAHRLSARDVISKKHLTSDEQSTGAQPDVRQSEVEQPRVPGSSELTAELKIPETLAKNIPPSQRVSIDTRVGIVAGDVARIDPSVQHGAVTVDMTITETQPKDTRPDIKVDGTIERHHLFDVPDVGRPATGQEQTVDLLKVLPDDTVIPIAFEGYTRR